MVCYRAYATLRKNVCNGGRIEIDPSGLRIREWNGFQDPCCGEEPETGRKEEETYWLRPTRPFLFGTANPLVETAGNVLTAFRPTRETLPLAPLARANYKLFSYLSTPSFLPPANLLAGFEWFTSHPLTLSHTQFMLIISRAAYFMLNNYDPLLHLTRFTVPSASSSLSLTLTPWGLCLLIIIKELPWTLRVSASTLQPPSYLDSCWFKAQRGCKR